MPLHDWTDRDNFDALHHMWIAELVRLHRHTLPPPYQVLLGSNPRMSVGGSQHRPDVGVANGHDPNGSAPTSTYREPDAEVMIATLEEDLTVQVERNGRIAADLAAPLPSPPAPCAVVYRVGESRPPDGRLLAVWAEPLTVGEVLPAMSLPLTVHLSVPIDLEGTYTAAAESCYL